MPAINKNDIVQSGLFIDEINNSKKLIQELDKLDDVFRSLSKNSKTLKEDLDLGKVEDLDKFLSLQKSVNSQFEDSIKISKERISIQKKLNDQTLKQKKTLEQLTADVANLRQQRKLLDSQEKQGLITAKEANAQRAKLNVELKQSTTALNSAVKSVTTLTKAEKDLQIVQSKEAGTIQKLNAQNRILRREREELNLDTKEGVRRLREINREIDENNRKLERNSDQLKKQRIGVGRYSKAIKQNITRFIGWTAVISVLTRALRGASKTIVNFDKSLGDLRGLINKTTRSAEENRKIMDKLEKSAKRLGRTSIFTATQVSQLQKEYAKLGFSGQEILNVTESTLTLAQATNTDLPRAAEVVGNTLRAFQLNSTQTARVVDVMTKSFNISSLDMERFATSMANVGPVAASAGVSVERTTALLGTLTSAGLDASTAGTGLRNVFLELSKSGLTFEEAMGQISSATDKNAKALELFGKRGAVIGTVLADNTETTKEWTKELENAGGTAESVANEQMDTLSGQIKGLESAWEGFILALEDGDGVIARVIRGALEGFTNLLNRITDLTRTEADKLNQIVEESTSKNAELVGSVFQRLREDAKKGVNELLEIQKELKSLEGDDRTKAVEQRIKNIDRLIAAQKDGVISVKELIKIGESTNIDLGAENATVKMEELNKTVANFAKELDGLQIDELEVREFNLALGSLGISKIFTTDEIKRLKELESTTKGLIKTLADEATVGSASIDAYKESLRNIFRDRSTSVQTLENIVETGSAIQQELAKQEIQRRELLKGSTENEKKENNKKLDNYKRYLEEKIRLDQRYRDERLKLERQGIELDSDLAKQQNEIRLKEVEKLIEQEQALQLARINAGQQIEFEKLDELYKRREMLASESYRIEADIALKKNEEVFNDEFKKLEELRLKRIENLNNQGITSDTESGKAEIERVNAEIDELERKLDENREKRRDEIKIEREQKEKEQNEEFLDREREFNNEVVEAEKKKNEELLKAQEEADKKEEERNEKKKKAQKELYETLFGIAKAFSERWQQEIDKNIEKLDEEIKTSKDRVSELKNNSSQNRQTIDDNIAFEEKRQAQLEKQKLEQEKKKRQIELATTAVEVYSNKVANDDPNPLLNTIKDITLLQQFVKNLPLFYTGTNTTVGDALGSPTLNTQKDGYVVRVDKDEKILNPYLSAMTGNMTTKEIAQVSSDYQKGILSYSNPYDLMSQSSTVTNVMRDVTNSVLISQVNRQNEKIDETNKKLDALINKPVSSIFLDDTGAVPKIVQETIKGNIKENKNRYLR